MYWTRRKVPVCTVQSVEVTLVAKVLNDGVAANHMNSLNSTPEKAY